MGKDGAYHLGFFAAITIEADNVVLDLNGKTIRQSKLHNLQQRFYANIELASAPFIPKQGPASFGDTVVSPTNVMIVGGTLGLSSHHGIHGNGMKNVVLRNLTIKDMEVAAIALNGAENSVISDINIENISTNIKVLSTYSQGIFIKSFLTSLQRRNRNATLQISANESKDISKVISELDAELESTKRDVLFKDSVPPNIFGNPSQLYDGNVYGIVLNILGVVINDFMTQRSHNASGNKHIYMHNIHVNNIISQPAEIPAINSAPEENTAYSGKRMAGPVGDIFEITQVTNKNKYKENSLANAQLILAKYNDPPNGTTNIEAPIVEWVEKQYDLTTVMADNGYYYVGAGDSMGHTMKGNIGLFISCGLDLVLSKIRIDGVEAKGHSVGTSREITKQDKKGAGAIGIMITGSSNVEMRDVEIKNVSSDNGKAENIKIMSSKNIVQK